MSGNELEEVRRQKLNRLEEKGIAPYKNKFTSLKMLSEIKEEFQKYEKKEVKVVGRIMSLREHGKSTFLDIQNEGRIQVYFKIEIVGEENYEVLKLLDIGDYIGVEGSVFKTHTGEITILAKSFTPLAKCLKPLPQEWHGLQDVEIRYRKRYLDLIMNPQVRNIFLTRSKTIAIIREFLNKHNFIEVETPMMQPLPGGALARPFITHHNALDIDLFLRIAPELYLKKLLVGGYEKIYEINRNFRNEGISTKHNPEFTMLELYWAYADYEVLMELTEEILKEVVKEIKGKEEFTYQANIISLKKKWKSITYHESFKKYCGIDIKKDEEKVRKEASRKGIDTNEPFWKLLDFLFKKCVAPNLIEPTFVKDYPTFLSPLAKEKEEGIVERFQPFIGGLEIGNAYTELNDPREQEKRFIEQANMREEGDEEAHYLDKDFVTALEYGMPPTAGLGVGIDRLVMLLTDTTSIREVILFPLLRPET